MIWPQLSLGELCDVLDSRRKPVTKRDRIAGEFPYYGATGILDYVARYIFDEKLVLVGEDGAKWGSGEKTAFSVEGRYWVNNHAHVIRPDRTRVLDEWIIYYLNFSDLSKFITGLTVPKLNQGKLCEIPIPLPPLPEQQRVVAILDETFAGLANATAHVEKNLRNARELFDSYLNSVFVAGGDSWKERRLGDVVVSVNTGPFGSLLHKSDYVSDGVPIVNPINIVDGAVSPDVNKTVSVGTAARLAAYKLSSDDVVVGRRGEIGRCAVVRTDQAGWLCGTGCFFIKTGEDVSADFLCHLLRSVDCSKRLERVATGATMKNLSNTALQNFAISLPPVSEQQRLQVAFGTLGEETHRAAKTYESKLRLLGALKQSILKKAFSGELTVPPSKAIKEAAE